MTPRPTYRPDIDGLRAVAVLSVVLYHFGATWIPGGFTGVDVFFVISGFVITAKLRKEILAGEFSIFSFYDGRVRRIFPALLVMLAVTMAAGWFILAPEDYSDLGESAAFAAFGLGNLFFYWNTGYFDQASELQPLLHTWSLGVEEQFYIVWPLILWLALTFIRFRAAHAALFLGLVAIGMAYGQLIISTDPKGSFYLPFPRAWELALGAALVFLPAQPHRIISNLMATAGALLIAYSLLFIRAEEIFPGINAAYACVGAALLIWPKNTTTVAGFLSLPAVVFVGLISYSLYLWHWPVIVIFTHYNNQATPSLLDLTFLVAASGVISVLSWRLVETPFRTQNSPKGAFVFLVTLMMGTLAAGLLITFSDGAVQRLPLELRKLASYGEYAIPDHPDFVCGVNSTVNSVSDFDDRCLQGSQGKPNVLLIGDSHALHLYGALGTTFPASHFSLATGTYCRPVLHAEGDPGCAGVMQHVFNEIASGRKFDAIILSARWQNGGIENLPETLALLTKHVPRVIVFGQTIEYGSSLVNLLTTQNLFRRDRDATSAIANPDRFSDLNANIAKISFNAGAEFYSPVEALCQGIYCKTLSDSAPINFDYGHFTAEGALYVLRQFVSMGLSLQ